MNRHAVAFIVLVQAVRPQLAYENGHKRILKRSKKGMKSMKGKDKLELGVGGSPVNTYTSNVDATALVGNYYAPNDVGLIPSDGPDGLEYSATWMSIEKTADPDLFLGKHCWRPSPNSTWISETFGLVVKTVTDDGEIQFFTAEVRDDETPGAGFKEGRHDGADSIAMVYLEPGNGFVMKLLPVRTQTPLDENACPI